MQQCTINNKAYTTELYVWKMTDETKMEVISRLATNVFLSIRIYKNLLMPYRQTDAAGAVGWGKEGGGEVIDTQIKSILQNVTN